MKLSEAIRIGIQHSLPLRDKFAEIEGTTVRACAIGAALLANRTDSYRHWNYVTMSEIGFESAEEEFPQLLYKVTYKFPDETVPMGGRELWYVIATLNDKYLWHRVTIAEAVAELGY